MNITKKLAELHKLAHNIRRHSDVSRSPSTSAALRCSDR